MAAARRAMSASVVRAHDLGHRHRHRGRSRSWARQASRTTVELGGRVLGARRTQVVLGRRRWRPGRGVRLGPPSADDDRGVRPLHRLGQGRAVDQGVVAALEGVGRARRRRPQPRHDGQLLLQTLEPLAHGWKRDAVGGVLGVVPGGTDPSSTRPPLMASTWATLMASGPGSRKVAAVIRVPRRMVLVSRAIPARVIQASVGPGRPSARAHGQVVVAAEEGAEAEALGRPGDGQEIVVGGTLLGLGEDAEVHASGLRSARAPDARGQPIDRPWSRAPSSISASAAPTSPMDMARSSLGRSSPDVRPQGQLLQEERGHQHHHGDRHPHEEDGVERPARTSRGSRAARRAGTSGARPGSWRSCR